MLMHRLTQDDIRTYYLCMEHNTEENVSAIKLFHMNLMEELGLL